MSKETEAILKDALSLTDAERAEVAGVLLESIESPPDIDVEQAWRDEVARRIADLDTGKVETIPWDQIRDELYARLSGRSS